jgi:hypothetical protein
LVFKGRHIEAGEKAGGVIDDARLVHGVDRCPAGSEGANGQTHPGAGGKIGQFLGDFSHQVLFPTVISNGSPHWKEGQSGFHYLDMWNQVLQRLDHQLELARLGAKVALQNPGSGTERFGFTTSHSDADSRFLGGEIGRPHYLGFAPPALGWPRFDYQTALTIQVFGRLEYLKRPIGIPDTKRAHQA